MTTPIRPSTTTVTPPLSARDTAATLITQSPVPGGGLTANAVRAQEVQQQQREQSRSRERAFLTDIVTQMQERGAADAEIYNYLVHYQGIRPAMLKVLNPPPDPDGTPEAPGVVGGVALSAIQGLSFGFGDEAFGLIAGLAAGISGKNMRQAAQNTTENFRGALGAFREERGGLAFTGEIGGALLGGVAGVRLMARLARSAGAVGRGAAALQRTVGPGASALAKPATVAATGAIAGGLQAAGDTQGGLGERAGAVPLGAAFGGVGAVALVGGARLVGNLARPVVRQATLGSRWLQQRLPGIGTPEMQARELVLRALEADGLTTAEVRRRAAERAAQGLPTTLADIGGERTRELLGAAVRERSPAKQKVIDALLSRQVEQGDQILGDIMTSVFRNNVPGLRLSYHAADELQKTMRAKAAPFYQDAYQQTVPITDNLRALLRRPHFRKAYKEGLALAREEDIAGTSHGLPVPKLRLDKPRRPAGFGRDVEPIEGLLTFDNPALDVQHSISTRVPVRALDLMKRGLDTIIDLDRQAAKPTISRQRAKAWRAELNAVLEEADEVVPSYQQARAISQHGFELRDAVDLGRSWAKTHPEEIQKIMRELPTEGAKEAYRLGAMMDLADAIDTHRGQTINFANRFFGGNLSAAENAMTKRIRALFADPDVAEEFIERVHHQARMSQTFAEIGNHRSAAQPLDDMMDAAVGSGQLPIRGGIGATIRGGGVSFFGRAVARQRTGWTREVSDAISELYLRGLRDPGDLDALLSSLTSKTLRTATTARLAAPVAIGQQAGKLTVP